jgi:hypothetical protein
MIGKAGLKAGLIGAVVMVVITLINQFLLLEAIAGNIALTLASCGVSIALYVGVGVLAGWFLAPTRTPGNGAKAGAIAGLISAIVSVVLGVAIMAMRTAGGSPIPGMTPEQMEMLAEQGRNVGQLVMISGAVGAVCGAAMGAGAAAGGGALLAAIQPD